ncbi:MAG: Flp pilus assembly protein CpaB [Nitrospinota bacterium]
MNLRRLLVPLIVALGLGLAAGALVMRQSARTDTAGQQQEKTAKIVVMAKEITRGVKLVKEDIELGDWPERLAGPDFIRSLSEADGRILVFNMVKGEPLLRSKLAAEDSAEGLSTLIPSNRRAFTIRVNDVTGVGGFLLPGSRVDIYATFELEVPAESGTGTRKTSVTRNILQDVEILAAGGVQEAGKKKSGSSVPMVTLLLTPEESAKVALAGTGGSLWLAMRNPRDKAVVSIPPVTVEDLLRSGPAAAPAAGAGPPGAGPPERAEAPAFRLSSRIPEGKRAITISVNDVTGVAGFLLPGNHVDVHATFELEMPSAAGGQASKTHVTKIIVQDIEVLTAGAVRDMEASKARIPVVLVTLLASPEQSDRLALASVAAKMWLSLRNPKDNQVNDDVKSVGISEILRPGSGEGRGRREEVQPARRATGHTIEIIQGGKKTKVEF